MGYRLTKEMCTMHNSCGSTITIKLKEKNYQKVQTWHYVCRQAGMGGKELQGVG